MTDSIQSASPSSQRCKHADLHYDIHTVSFEINVKSVEIRCRCNDCGEKMRFLGLPLGVSFAQPTASADGEEIRLPMCPASEEPDKAPGLIGQIERACEALKGTA